MKLIKAFWYIYVKSISSFKYYKEVIKLKLGFSAKYYAALVILASLIITASESMAVIPGVKATTKEFITNIQQLYPKDFVFKINDGKWEINREEPFIISTPTPSSSENIPVNLIVFYKEGTIDDLDNFNSLILVNDVNVIVKQTNEISAYPLKGFPNTEFNKQDFDELIGIANSVIKFLPYAIAVFIFFGLLVYFFVFRLVYIAIVGFVLWILSKLTQTTLNYENSVKVAIHTMTVPITLQIILNVSNLANKIPFTSWFFFVNIVFAMLVLTGLSPKKEKKK